MALQHTPIDEIPKLVQKVRDTFKNEKTVDVSFRKAQLRAFYRMIEENIEQLTQAVHQDIHKPKHETMGTEIMLIKNEIVHSLNHLSSWITSSAEKKLANIIDELYVKYDPLGVVLIIGAWNYPLLLTLQPMVGAIAAGNTVVLKPSEISPHSATKITELIGRYLDPESYVVINGGVEETTHILEQRFDHIFFTGNSTVGKIVMKAASNFLTPVTLELGGKSPTIIDHKVDIKIATRRILWGKCLNAGQTCIAPDYVLCHKSQYQSFLEELKIAHQEFFGANPQQHPDFARIINQRQFQRLKGYLDATQRDPSMGPEELNPNGHVFFGGQMDEQDLFMSFTVLTNISAEAPVMQNEIFGPILPVLEIENIEEAVYFINSREKPLALYLFSQDKSSVDAIVNRTSSGGLVINDTMLHLSVPSLPFGGVGNSGMGNYHGKRTFETFSHKKAVMKRPFVLSQLDTLRYPPLSDKKFSYLELLLAEKPAWGALSEKEK